LPLRRLASQIGAKLYAILCTTTHFARLALLFEGMLGYGISILHGVHCVIAGKTSSARETETVIAVQFTGGTDAEGFPAEQAWENALAIHFAHDWQGKNEDPGRKTETRVLWTRETLFVKFLARYRSLTVFADAEPNGRRDQLWERDVAEVFLQPVGPEGRHYKEFEVSPNGFWIDLDIAPGEKRDLKSGLRRRARIDEKASVWKAELALPMKSLTARFDPSEPWRVNFYRVEGRREPRFYSAWRPTGTPVPNFHVPESFGTLVFET
jgi:alpha-galactosidase